MESGWNVLVGVDSEQILAGLDIFPAKGQSPALFGDGQSAHEIVRILGEERIEKKDNFFVSSRVEQGFMDKV